LLDYKSKEDNKCIKTEGGDDVIDKLRTAECRFHAITRYMQQNKLMHSDTGMQKAEIRRIMIKN
jgi:hypothetical protein